MPQRPCAKCRRRLDSQRECADFSARRFLRRINEGSRGRKHGDTDSGTAEVL